MTTLIKSSNIAPGTITAADIEASGVTAASYGSASQVPVITVNAQGLITAASTTSVAGVSSFSWDSSTETLNISTADGGSFNADISGMASESYVDTAIDNLIDSAPGTLDTLNEIATAIQNNDTDIATILSTQATKVDKINITGATVGSASAVPVITFNAQGQITSATTTAVAGVSSTSFSGGVLTINTSDGSSYTTDFDTRYFTETEANANFLGINAKAADSDTLDGLNSTQFLRSDANDTTTGRLSASGGITSNATGAAVGAAGLEVGVAQNNTAALILGQNNVINWRIRNQATTGTLEFSGATSGDVKMAIDTSGNVGIGTTNPSTILHLAGDASPTITLTSSSGPRSYIESNTVGSVGIAADESNTGTSSNINFRVDGAERMRIYDSGDISIKGANGNNNFYWDASDSYNYGQLKLGNGSGVSGEAMLAVSRNYGDITNPLVHFDITGNDGRVLRVSSDTARTDMQIFDVINNNGTAFAVRGDGNVGIGTGNPGTSLDVVGTVTADKYDNDEALPTIRPSLLLDFANSKTLGNSITFTRSSTATYWDGKTTVKADENLFKQSQDFNNTTYWSPNNNVITSNNATAPDGTTTADKLAQAAGTTNNAQFAQLVPSVAGVEYTVSIFAKAGTRNYITLREYTYDDSPNYSHYNLSNGTVVSSDSAHTSDIRDVGNGWYRCTMTFTSGFTRSTNNWYVFCAADTTSPETGADDGGYIYVWGAQIEQRDSAAAYTPTSSDIITKYQPKLLTASVDVPRFDHNPVTSESKGLLMEEQRTNLAPHSIPYSSWYLSNVIFESYAIAPDGTNTAIMTRGSGSSSYQWYDPRTLSSGTNRTYSCYFKKVDARYCYLANDPQNAFAWFDLDDNANVVHTTDCTAGSEYVGNGWYRCWMTNDNNINYHQIGFNNTYSTSQSWGLASSTSSSGIAWGYQLEEGAFPTSHIPTNGSQLTRSTESASIPYSSVQDWYAQGKGTFYSEFAQLGEGGSRYGNILSLGPIDLTAWDAQSDEIKFLVYNYTYYVNITKSNYAVNQYYKAAATFDNNDAALSVDGVLLGTDSSAVIPNISSSLDIGSSSNTCVIKKIAYYPSRLTNATLQAITED